MASGVGGRVPALVPRVAEQLKIHNRGVQRSNILLNNPRELLDFHGRVIENRSPLSHCRAIKIKT